MNGKLYMCFCVSVDQEFVADCVLPHQTVTPLVMLGDVRQFLWGGFGKQSAQLLQALQHQPEWLWQAVDVQNLEHSGLHTDYVYLEFHMPFLTKIWKFQCWNSARYCLADSSIFVCSLTTDTWRKSYLSFQKRLKTVYLTYFHLSCCNKFMSGYVFFFLPCT